MAVDYSKPAGDVAVESQQFLDEDGGRLGRQQVVSAGLAAGTERRACLLCASTLGTPLRFTHRGVDYACCASCGHVQTVVQPPAGYPHRTQDGIAYGDIYPELDRSAYASRRDRIYRPKLDWIIRQLIEVGRSEEHVLQSRWLEFGAGAGYFLDALRVRGARRIAGLERDGSLVNRANTVLGGETVRAFNSSLADAVGGASADILVAFFALEHVDDPRAFWAAMATTAPGTVLAFSVPCFGMAALLESAFSDHAARCLDSVVHTQLYTDESIAFALALARMRNVGTWHFGQDAIDLRRLLLVRLRDRYSPALLAQIGRSLSDNLDTLQAAIDRSHLSDSRHIVAVRER